MKTTLRCLIGVVALTATLAMSADAQQPGWGVGFRGHDREYGFELRRDVFLGGDVSRITGQAGMVFPSSGAALTADADYHFAIAAGSGRFYPLAGVGMKTDFDYFKVGVNAGGGANLMITETLAAYLELKYVFFGWEGFAFVFGAYF